MLTNSCKNSIFQSASFNMIAILSVFIASKCLVVHFKLSCGTQQCWIVNKATEMTFPVFSDFITCWKTCSKSWKSEVKVLFSRKLCLYLLVRLDSLIFKLISFWFYEVLNKSIKDCNDFSNVLYQNPHRKAEFILEHRVLVIPLCCWVPHISSVQVQFRFCGITLYMLHRLDW